MKTKKERQDRSRQEISDKKYIGTLIVVAISLSLMVIILGILIITEL